jgi:hypothetical protein
MVIFAADGGRVPSPCAACGRRGPSPSGGEGCCARRHSGRNLPVMTVDEALGTRPYLRPGVWDGAKAASLRSRGVPLLRGRCISYRDQWLVPRPREADRSEDLSLRSAATRVRHWRARGTWIIPLRLIERDDAADRRRRVRDPGPATKAWPCYKSPNPIRPRRWPKPHQERTHGRYH